MKKKFLLSALLGLTLCAVTVAPVAAGTVPTTKNCASGIGTFVGQSPSLADTIAFSFAAQYQMSVSPGVQGNPFTGGGSAIGGFLGTDITTHRLIIGYFEGCYQLGLAFDGVTPLPALNRVPPLPGQGAWLYGHCYVGTTKYYFDLMVWPGSAGTGKVDLWIDNGVGQFTPGATTMWYRGTLTCGCIKVSNPTSIIY